MKSQNAQVAPVPVRIHQATMTNIIGTREMVSTLGRVNFTRPVETSAVALASTVGRVVPTSRGSSGLSAIGLAAAEGFALPLRLGRTRI